MASTKELGFCGLGAMGFGMAAHLVKQGYTVRGFDVSKANLERFAQVGGVAAPALRESAEGMLYYIIMVANAAQAQSVLFEGSDSLAKTLPQGATLMLCSTVSSVDAKKFAGMLTDCGRDDIYFIDSPVSGGNIRAAEGTLSIMAGASDDAIDRGSALLREMSDKDKLYVVAGGVGQGSNMKMAHQVLAAIQILATSEAYGLAAHLGLDADLVHGAVLSNDSSGWMFENRSLRTLTEDYNPCVSALTIILKDAGIITSTARLDSFPVPLTSAAEQIYFNGLQRGWASDDDAGMVRWYFSNPVRSVKQDLSPEEGEKRLHLIVQMLITIHTCAAMEATALAKHARIPLQQFAELASNAAGSTVMFRKVSDCIARGNSEEDMTVDSMAKKLDAVVAAAQSVRCPVPLSSTALNTLLSLQRQHGDKALIEII